MHVTKRTVTLTLVNGTMATVNIMLKTHKMIMSIDTDHLVAKTVIETPNSELVTPSTITIADPTLAGRFTLLSSNEAPHSGLGYMLYYDNKYNDIIVIPSLEIYKSMSYLNNQMLTISGYGVNFSGISGDKLPALNPLYDIKSTLANLTNYVKNQVRGVYFERMITPTRNYSSASVSPILLINFGTPAMMFPVLDFVTDINVFGYDSLFTNSPQQLGNQKLQNIGTLVVSIPL